MNLTRMDHAPHRTIDKPLPVQAKLAKRHRQRSTAEHAVCPPRSKLKSAIQRGRIGAPWTSGPVHSPCTDERACDACRQNAVERLNYVKAFAMEQHVTVVDLGTRPGFEFRSWRCGRRSE